MNIDLAKIPFAKGEKWFVRMRSAITLREILVTDVTKKTDTQPIEEERMRKGKLRKEIIDQCPEEFRDCLGDWINDLELCFKDILSKLDDVNNLGDLHMIEDVRNDLSEMCDGLY